VLEVRSGSPPPGAAWIEVRDEEIRADLAKVTAATLHFDGQDREREHDAERVAVDALTMVALAFERLGQDDIASRLASTYFTRSSLATNLDAAFALSSSMARAHRIAESLELSEELDDPSNESLEGAAMVFGFPALYKARSLSQSEVTQHEQVLKQRAKRRKKSHPVAAGRAYMNLAGLQRSRNNWDAATSYYELALKLDPAYQHRAHYWYEYGGALWGTGQFAKGADSYRRSIELGTTEPLAVALEADCLMFAGKYAGALDLFDAFNKEHPEDDGEYRLKARAVRAVVERLEIHEQERRPFRAVEAAEGDEPHTASEWAQVSLKQLAVDALWGSAWLNLGIADFEQGHLDQALDSFVAATILIVEDYETWDNAIVTAFALGESDVLTDLVVSGRRMGGDALIASVIDFAKRPGSVIPLNEFGARIDGILTEHSPGVRSGFTVRMLREDGSVEEVVIEDEPDEPSPQGPATSSSG
jgi:tetratricopeptide (TPR) repeat protein